LSGGANKFDQAKNDRAARTVAQVKTYVPMVEIRVPIGEIRVPRWEIAVASAKNRFMLSKKRVKLAKTPNDSPGLSGQGVEMIALALEKTIPLVL
jgi:hypothetical protein